MNLAQNPHCRSLVNVSLETHLRSLNPFQKTFRNFVQNSAPKTCELDPAPTSLLMELLDIVLPTLTRIVNDWLTSGIFPQIHKSTVVKPQLKKPTLDDNNLKNFRPVSNLSFLSKIIEKIVLFPMSDHLLQQRIKSFPVCL